MKVSFAKRLSGFVLAFCMVAGLFGVLPITAQAQIHKVTEVTKLPDNVTYLDTYGTTTSYFSEGLAVVSKKIGQKIKYGYIDRYGQIAIQFEYDWAQNFRDGLALVGYGGPTKYEREYLFIDKNGNTVITSLPYDEIGEFHDGLAFVGVAYDFVKDDKAHKAYKYGYIDKTGKVVIPIEYDEASNFSEGLALVGKGYEAGFINISGELVVPFRYAKIGTQYMMGFVSHIYNATSFSGGFASIGFEWFDKEGNVVSAPANAVANERMKSEYSAIYEDVYELNDGVARVRGNIDGKRTFGLIDINGNIIIPLGEYSELGEFIDGVAIAKRLGTNEIGLIDKAGNVIVNFGYYQNIGTINDGFAIAQRDGSYYILQISATTPALTATPTASTVLVNGKSVAFDAYNISGNNYFKLRDLGYILSGTEKQFDVGWDGANNAISLTSDQAYTVVGGEMEGKGSGSKTPTATTSKIYLDGKEVSFTAYNIEGNNYFKLRDIGEAFDFGVAWDGASNTIVIDTSKGYTAD